MPAHTLLSIDAIDFSQWAVRGITMTLEPIDQATASRAIAGASWLILAGAISPV